MYIYIHKHAHDKKGEFKTEKDIKPHGLLSAAGQLPLPNRHNNSTQGKGNPFCFAPSWAFQNIKFFFRFGHDRFLP